MSMLKKTAALTVSAVLLLQPMTASAVTWNNIVDGLRNSGSNRYTEDGTTIEKDGDNYTVSGGTIDEYGWIDEGYFGKNGRRQRELYTEKFGGQVRGTDRYKRRKKGHFDHR